MNEALQRVQQRVVKALDLDEPFPPVLLALALAMSALAFGAALAMMASRGG